MSIGHNTFVHCERKNCVYFIHNKNEGQVYQDQCGNDEIEIGIDLQCYSYDEKKIKKGGKPK